MAVAVCWRTRSWRPGSKRARFLAVVAVHFTETSNWASLGIVQNGLARSHDLSDARKTARRLPQALGRLEGDRVILTVRGIRQVDPTNPVLVDFERALVLVARAYLNCNRGVRETTVSRQELVEGLGLSEPRADRVMKLLVAESLASSSASDGARVRVTPEIVPFLHVRNVDEYVRQCRRLDLRHGLQWVRERPRALLGWFRSPEESKASKVAVGVLIAVIAALLIAVALGASQSQSQSDDNVSRKSDAARSGG